MVFPKEHLVSTAVAWRILRLGQFEASCSDLSSIGSSIDYLVASTFISMSFILECYVFDCGTKRMAT